VSGAAEPARALARVVAGCAVLVGLFFMHGVSAAAPDGCHGMAMAPPALAMAAGVGAGHEIQVAMPAGRTATLVGPGPGIAPESVSSGHGELCLSTAPRPGPSALVLLAIALALMLAASTWASPTLWQVLRPRRAPPPPTAQRLTVLCISRT
jgi:hypothetical protein